MGLIEWIKKPSAMGEVMQSRVKEALDARREMDYCKSRLRELRKDCPYFQPKKEKE